MVIIHNFHNNINQQLLSCYYITSTKGSGVTYDDTGGVLGGVRTGGTEAAGGAGGPRGAVWGASAHRCRRPLRSRAVCLRRRHWKEREIEMSQIL